MQNKNGFTLAEVLITLVVIGIIAAITVPVVMANHRKTETATRLKKFYSNFTNAIKLAEIEQGIPADEWDPGNGEDEYFGMIFKHLNYFEWDNNQGRIIFADGTKLDYNCGPIFCLYFDVNGDKGPNEMGRDIFAFELYNGFNGGAGNAAPLEKDIVFTPEYPQVCRTSNEKIECTREQVKQECADDSDGHFACTYLIMYDGWEIKGDYPLKI